VCYPAILVPEQPQASGIMSQRDFISVFGGRVST
jgi:hypothetical protein